MENVIEIGARSQDRWEQRWGELVDAVYGAAYTVVEKWDDVPGLDAHGEEWIDCCFAEDLHAWVTSRVKPLCEELRQGGWKVVQRRDREYTMELVPMA